MVVHPFGGDDGSGRALPVSPRRARAAAKFVSITCHQFCGHGIDAGTLAVLAGRSLLAGDSKSTISTVPARRSRIAAKLGAMVVHQFGRNRGNRRALPVSPRRARAAAKLVSVIRHQFRSHYIDAGTLAVLAR
jgi:hypothetical protein